MWGFKVKHLFTFIFTSRGSISTEWRIQQYHRHTHTDGHTEWLLELPVEAKNLNFCIRYSAATQAYCGANTYCSNNVGSFQCQCNTGNLEPWLANTGVASFKKIYSQKIFHSQDVLISMNARLLLHVALTPSAPTLSAPSPVTVSWVMSSGLLTGAVLT